MFVSGKGFRRGRGRKRKEYGDIGVWDGGQGGAVAPQFGQFVDIHSGREATLFGQNTIHV